MFPSLCRQYLCFQSGFEVLKSCYCLTDCWAVFPFHFRIEAKFLDRDLAGHTEKFQIVICEWYFHDQSSCLIATLSAFISL